MQDIERTTVSSKMLAPLIDAVQAFQYYNKRKQTDDNQTKLLQKTEENSSALVFGISPGYPTQDYLSDDSSEA